MPNEVKLLPCPFCEGEVEAIHAKHDLIWLEHLDHNRCSVFNDGVWTTTKAWNTRPTTVVTDEVVEREHVMPGDPDHLQQTALQWWLRFNFGGPIYTNRESNIAVESFKDGYRAALASMPTVVTGEQSEDLGDHALPPSGLSR